MAKFVYIIGTADTKLEELLWLKSCLRSARVDSHIIDVSTGSSNAFHENNRVDINATQIAAYHPDGMDAVFCGERGKAVTAMSIALSHFLRSTADDISGLIGIGGSGGTALITAAMQTMPIGIPKLMVSTMASGNVGRYIGGVDIAMLYTVTDLSGLNYLSRTILANAANMIAGAVNCVVEHQCARKPVLGLTMFGVTTPCINQLIASLGEQFDPLVFHATGNGGTSMERLVESREIVGVLDITLTEVADLLFGGVLACPETRLDCIAKTQTPWVGSAGALDMINFSDRDSIPERYAHRQFVEHNAQVTLMRTTPGENYQLGVWIGNKLNLCEGPVRFIIPEGGFSALDAPGQPFFDPQARQAFAEGLESTVIQTAQRQIIKAPHHINAPEFCSLVIAQFQDIMQHQRTVHDSTPGKSL
ncbi:Tm-1-like ATP-binding domain-containing protein [Serratia fonticola]|uniref:Tm-1-like ATP-binding domain-containing protein n=1 Tax=Serratia fonticola TaxID=47917 RepID=A0AAW3WJZ3_SERFO|nr:Tm-1-like ATP-binding domain-containing protein [Serratia fonticola]MBC3211026.1 Tm-1-like ATP-binding domain-containing protein [Serratia fonticola]NYA12008.1 Tm-1-like ATP-binding domain-containing protein [Serratia fonticola]NYA31587.1 Tm-1-like ATP-binding domain-containing protein [Serratia fonticola]